MTIVIFSEVNRMKSWTIITIIGTVLVATALVTATAFAYMGGRGFNGPFGTNADSGSYGVYPGGMMGGAGMMGGYGRGSGMMGGYGYGTTTPLTASGQYGWGDCHGRTSLNGYAGSTNNGTALTIDAAVSIAQNYLASLSNNDLAIEEVEEYTQNFYVLFKEKSTGIGAFEMLIDKFTGSIYPEMGPNMMWNTKYGSTSTAGMMGGMMSGYAPYTGTPTTTMTVTATQATTNAQQFLNSYLSGATTEGVTTFHGYYTIEVLNSGTTYGMLSVNGYTGQVWYHNWHGTFVQEVELS